MAKRVIVIYCQPSTLSSMIRIPRARFAQMLTLTEAVAKYGVRRT